MADLEYVVAVANDGDLQQRIAASAAGEGITAKVTLCRVRPVRRLVL